MPSRRAPPFSWRLQNTKNQYFLILEHQKSIFSIPGAPKINIFCPRGTKNQYFFSVIKNLSVSGAPKINIFWPRTRKSIFSVPRPLKINKSILSVRNRLTNNQTPSAVAGTQLCCALDTSFSRHRSLWPPFCRFH